MLRMALFLSPLLCGIHIWEPKSLKAIYQNRELDYTIMNFGTVPYGHTIYGTVFIASPYNACSELAPLKWDKNYGTLILMVERGGCNFSEKVINAQKVGAGFVVIADNNQEDVHKIFPIERSKELLEKVRIASILISKNDADNIKNAAGPATGGQGVPAGAMGPGGRGDAAGGAVELAIFFDLVKSNGKAELKFILQVDDYRSYDLVLEYFDNVGKMKSFIEFLLHFKIFFNSSMYFDGEDCLNSGVNNFCVFKSFGNEKKNLGLITESIRQLCLYTSDRKTFVDYLRSVRSSCFENDLSVVSNFKNCTSDIYESKVSSKLRKELEKCNTPDSTENINALANNNEEIKYLLINYAPLIFINGAYYKGNYEEISHLFETICNGFDSPPEPCKTFEGFQSTEDLNASLFLRFVMKGVALCFFVSLFCIAAFYLGYKRRMKKTFDFSLNDKINEALAKYYSDDKEKAEENGYSSHGGEKKEGGADSK